jgi:adenylate cyclase
VHPLVTGKTWLLVLVTAEALTLVALAVTVCLLLRRGQEMRALQAQLQPAPAPARVRQAAGWAVRTAFDTAGRVRQRGFVGGLLMAPIEDLTQWAFEDRAGIDAVAAPDGTVTIVFSDIEDSTRLNEQLGDKGWVRVLADHDHLVRGQVRKHHGHVVKSQGDGFMIVFGDPRNAVDAALGIQRSVDRSRGPLRRTSVRVRIGVHVGTAVARDGDYFGRNVAKAARVAAAAAGGQVLVSDEVRESLETSGSGVPMERAGDHELKGLAGTHVLWELAC